MSQDKNFVQTGNNSTQIGIQNNKYYTYSTFNQPLKNIKKIKTKRIYNTIKERLFIIIFFPTVFVISTFYFYREFNIFTNSKFILFILASIIVLIYAINKKRESTLIIEDDKLILEEKDKINYEIEFKNIRSFLKQKSLTSYHFFIYEKTKIEPVFGFTFSSIHAAIAIEELLKHKIQEAINSKN